MLYHYTKNYGKTPMTNMSFKWRTLILALFPASLICVALYSYFIFHTIDLLNKSLNDRGLAMATSLAPESEYGIFTGNRDLLSGLVRAVLADDDVTGVAITDAQQNIFISTGSYPSLGSAENTHPSEYTGICHSTKDSLVFCAPVVSTRLPVDDFDERMDTESPEAPVIGWTYVALSNTGNLQHQQKIITQTLSITFWIYPSG